MSFDRLNALTSGAAVLLLLGMTMLILFSTLQLYGMMFIYVKIIDGLTTIYRWMHSSISTGISVI